MWRPLSLLAAVAIILSSGVAGGLITDRWGTSNEPRASADKLQLIPLTLGDWDGAEGQKMSAQHKAIGRVEDFIARNYTNRHTGVSVGLLLLCGRPGPIGVHTPDVCFVGAGQELMNKQRFQFEFEPGAPQAEFTVGQFRKTDADVQTYSRAFWAWSVSGVWSAPNSPRWSFAGNPALFKLYITRQMSDENEPYETGPIVDFAKLFLREANKSLFTPSASASDGTKQ